MLFSCDKDLRGQSPFLKPWTCELVQEETYRNPTKQAVIVRHGANCCQVIVAVNGHLPAPWGRARIQHPFNHDEEFSPPIGSPKQMIDDVQATKLPNGIAVLTEH